jgi:hypothetical protein
MGQTLTIICRVRRDPLRMEVDTGIALERLLGVRTPWLPFRSMPVAGAEQGMRCAPVFACVPVLLA